MNQTLTHSEFIDTCQSCAYVRRAVRIHSFHNVPRYALILTAIAATACAPAQRAPARVGDNRHSADPRNNLVGVARPGATVALPVADVRWIEQTVASLTLREKVAQLIMPWVGGEYVAVGSPEYEQLRTWVENDRVGGLVVSIGLPLSYAAKLNRMQRLARVPLLIASDMENGPGMRLGNSYAFPSLLPQGGGTVFPPVMAIGATGSDDLAYRLGRVTGIEARAVGVHITFGPVLDVNSNPANPIINTRSFGEDPAQVSRLAAAFIRGARDAGLMTTGKHFPGHGDTETDSHLDLPTISASRPHLDSVDLPPFRAAVADSVDAIMTAHIAAIAVLGGDAPPATLSSYFMTEVLRREMGFRGLLVTDAMTMGGVAKRYGPTEPLILALEAGADILLMPNSVEEAINTVAGAVQSGRIREDRINSSVRRVLEAKARAGLRTGRLVDITTVDEKVNVPANSDLAREIAERSITLARDTRTLVPVAPGAHRILSVSYADQTDPIAGRAFNAELQAAGLDVRTASVDSRTEDSEFRELEQAADSAVLIVASAYVSPRERKGSIEAEGGFSAFVERIAATGRPVIAVSFGSPYLLRFFPSVPAYLLAWGGTPLSQRAAARALLGKTAITGRLPVSLPPYMLAGAGIDRQATGTAP